MKVDCIELVPQVFAKLGHHVVLWIMLPLQDNLRATFRATLQHAHQRTDEFGAGTVEIAQIEMSFKSMRSHAGQREEGGQLVAHRAVKSHGVFGIGLARHGKAQILLVDEDFRRFFGRWKMKYSHVQISQRVQMMARRWNSASSG